MHSAGDFPTAFPNPLQQTRPRPRVKQSVETFAFASLQSSSNEIPERSKVTAAYTANKKSSSTHTHTLSLACTHTHTHTARKKIPQGCSWLALFSGSFPFHSLSRFLSLAPTPCRASTCSSPLLWFLRPEKRSRDPQFRPNSIR